MKKRLSALLLCILIITSLSYAGADSFEDGLNIEFNGEKTEYASVISENTHYVPLRGIFEEMGARVFYRSSDRQILALSRDGDIISHVVGDNKIIFNGKAKEFENKSVLVNDTAHIPLEMLSETLYPDGILYDNNKMNIQKAVVNNHYNKVVKEVLDFCNDESFYPERFQRYINYHVKNPGYTMEKVMYMVNLGLDYPFYEKITPIEHPHELLVLVNKNHKLPAGFSQYNMVNINPEYTQRDGKAYLLSAVAYEKCIQMLDEAKKAGLSIKVVSAYRTEAYQAGLYNNRLTTSGKVYADKYAARAGHSEHQTGLAIDVGITNGVFEYTDEFQWMKSNAHKYGYILRYPKGKEWITGYAYEPWHFRYVGTDVAKAVFEQGITYEEYYAKYIDVNEFE